jgi:flagellar M-ring protein FliF
LPAAGYAGAALDGEVETGFAIPGYPEAARDNLGEAGEEDPAARLRRLIEKRQAESIEILRGWMEQDEERA